MQGWRATTATEFRPSCALPRARFLPLPSRFSIWLCPHSRTNKPHNNTNHVFVFHVLFTVALSLSLSFILASFFFLGLGRRRRRLLLPPSPLPCFRVSNSVRALAPTTLPTAWCFAEVLPQSTTMTMLTTMLVPSGAPSPSWSPRTEEL